MPREEFIDPGPLLREQRDERLRELQEQFPEPRSRRDERRLNRAKRHFMREYRRAHKTAHWLTDPTSPDD